MTAWTVVDDSDDAEHFDVSISAAGRAKLAAEERDRAARIADTYSGFSWFGAGYRCAGVYENSRSLT